MGILLDPHPTNVFQLQRPVHIQLKIPNLSLHSFERWIATEILFPSFLLYKTKMKGYSVHWKCISVHHLLYIGKIDIIVQEWLEKNLW